MAIRESDTSSSDSTAQPPSIRFASVVGGDADDFITSGPGAAGLGTGKMLDERDAKSVAARRGSASAPFSASSSEKLSEYREKLARDLERREKKVRGLSPSLEDERSRSSLVVEEHTQYGQPQNSSPLLSSSSLATASTESGKTVRAGSTPGPVASTPSYPFPRMNLGQMPMAYRSLSNHLPTGAPRPSHMPYTPSGMHEHVMSTHTTPGSTITFQPAGYSDHQVTSDFPVPNIYDLSLMLSAEPGLDAWWAAVVQIMRTAYKAERVTLAIPADTTDIENVPWGQKATYNEHQEDALSLMYMGKDSSAVVGSEPDAFDSATPGDEGLRAVRPGLHSRHSYTTYEEKKVEAAGDQPGKRPSQLARSISYYPSQDQPRLNKNALQDLDGEQPEHIPSWEAPLRTRQRGLGRILPVLQALDYEADPLIDHLGVMRVLERGKPVALTRSYPYLAKEATPEPSAGPAQPSSSKRSSSTKKSRKQRTESMSKLSSMFTSSGKPRQSRSKNVSGDRSGAHSSKFEEDDPKPPTPVYEEYEQTPPSPWSQSPAPSPAIRTDTTENPFFTDAMVDEDSFNPGITPDHYENARPPEAIGVDNSWTVLHIPLSHVLLSNPLNPFKLDDNFLDQRRMGGMRGGDDDPTNPNTPGVHEKSNPTPIAILSILSPLIPYPSSLRRSLEHLAPHMATSFSLCRHYSNLETELMGLKRRRPSMAGFGAVATDGRPISSAYLLGGEQAIPPSAGSMTSPSDYSTVSKSATASPSGTPNWDQGSLNSIMDRRSIASPLAMASSGEGYFTSKLKSGSQKPHNPKTGSPGDKRHYRLSAPVATYDSLDLSNLSSASASDDSRRDGAGDRQAGERQGHTMLHTYGADFASTFQSLPPNSTVHSSRPPAVSLPSRGGSITTVDMPPPSDRLKGLMLDSLPAHVFVALPQNGEIVWVNSRFLSYRGQTVNDLAKDPWGNIHPDDRDDYLRNWGHCLRTGEQFSRTVRIRRFDGAYRWFYARAVASKDKRGVIMQFLGSYMDIHDQHIAELKAARQEEIEASEAKHRLLANLIPQIIFTATEEDGITFANEQWLSYTGQSFSDSLGLGFMDFVHPEDLAKCRIPINQPPTPLGPKDRSATSPAGTSATFQRPNLYGDSDSSVRGVHQALSRHNSSSSDSMYELPSADLTELARKGIIKVKTDANGRLSYTSEVRLRAKSGEYRWHLIRCVEIDTIDFGSGASSYFGSATDINDHKLLEAKLKEAMESKGRFLSNMSHEIRTPLIGISGMVSFLQDSVLNEEQRDYTNTIQTSANSLIMIINDILDLSKVDAGMMKLKFEWFHTRSLIEDVNELVSTMAIAKRLELNYLVEADVPAWVKGDKVRIRQVLLNVIGNAIKFTNEGEVFSRCRVIETFDSETEDHEIMLEFAIIDTGRGFTKEEADLIFKPFSQIDGSSTRQHGGSGLGLVISRQLVELHGGKMEGTAIPGQGSTFTFTARFGLPTSEDHPNQPASPSSTMSVTSASESSESVPPGNNKAANPVQRHLARKLDIASPAVAEAAAGSPVATSTGSSNLSIHSGQSTQTDQSSINSVSTGLTHFSEAAKASGQDISQMKLEINPSGRSSPGRLPGRAIVGSGLADYIPPIYSILILCPQHNSRAATKAHIEMTLPKDVPHQLTALSTVAEAQRLIAGEDAIKFTHIVINLPSAEATMDLMMKIHRNQTSNKTQILVLLDSVQRQSIVKLAASSKNESVINDSAVTVIYKPVKPSRFAVIFDPEKVQDLSVDRNRSTAQQMVASQKASYQQIAELMGHKGYKVLVVEDNPVNQKVLTKYMNKIGVEVEIAGDGVDCTDLVLSKPHQYYSLILCDLHMPRKDGYTACRDIRRWEKTGNLPKMPIIALSANVMSDVQEKCIAAGFSAYVTKPVDFIDLSRAMAKFF